MNPVGTLYNEFELGALPTREIKLSPREERILRVFPDATPEDWNDWTWQMRNRIKTKEELNKVIRLTKKEEEAIDSTGIKLKMAIPPYFASLMHPIDSQCPVRKQCVPSRDELLVSPEEMTDPCGEDKHSPVHGLVHRYPDRVLFLVSEMCAMYCRHCTRSRMVGEGQDHHTLNPASYDEAFGYIRAHKEIRDVLISGGDPLLLSDGLLEHILKNIRSISHVEFLRIGTRAPVTLPQRITPSLLKVLKRYGPIWMSLHFNHYKEITPKVKAACDLLADNGIPLGSQTVLLKGINDTAETMKKLMHELLKIRVRPYYIYQCDPIVGSRHFRTPVSTGLEIMQQLRGFTSGYAVPTFVIDAPGGGGKIPVSPNYVLSHQNGRCVLKNYAGDEYSYIDPQ